MHNFHYQFIKNNPDDKAYMLLINADSLMYKIEAENVYKDSCKDKELLNFSNYPKDLKYYSNATNLIVSKMKDEKCGSVPMKFCAGLKSKTSLRNRRQS